MNEHWSNNKNIKKSKQKTLIAEKKDMARMHMPLELKTHENWKNFSNLLICCAFLISVKGKLWAVRFWYYFVPILFIFKSETPLSLVLGGIPHSQPSDR